MSENAQAAPLGLKLAREGSEWIVEAGRQAAQEGKLSEGAYLELCGLSKDWCTGHSAYAALKNEHEALKNEHEALKDKHEELEVNHESLLEDFDDVKSNAFLAWTELDQLRAKYGIAEDVTVQCKVCKKLFKNRDFLDKHMISKHAQSSE